VTYMQTDASAKHRLMRRIKDTARNLLLEKNRLRDYRTLCPVCGGSRHVRRTDFRMLYRYPKMTMFLTSYLLNLASIFRALPDFLIIGAAKSGTTSLYGLITAHPDVLAARTSAHAGRPRRMVKQQGPGTGGRGLRQSCRRNQGGDEEEILVKAVVPYPHEPAVSQQSS